MEEAARQSLSQPQKMGTHCESWYGLFTGAAAILHDLDFDREAYLEKVRELVPLGFDVEQGCPTVHPGRIQNLSLIHISTHWIDLHYPAGRKFPPEKLQPSCLPLC